MPQTVLVGKNDLIFAIGNYIYIVPQMDNSCWLTSLQFSRISCGMSCLMLARRHTKLCPLLHKINSR